MKFSLLLKGKIEGYRKEWEVEGKLLLVTHYKNKIWDDYEAYLEEIEEVGWMYRAYLSTVDRLWSSGIMNRIYHDRKRIIDLLWDIYRKQDLIEICSYPGIILPNTFGKPLKKCCSCNLPSHPNIRSISHEVRYLMDFRKKSCCPGLNSINPIGFLWINSTYVKFVVASGLNFRPLLSEKFGKTAEEIDAIKWEGRYYDEFDIFRLMNRSQKQDFLRRLPKKSNHDKKGLSYFIRGPNLELQNINEVTF